MTRHDMFLKMKWEQFQYEPDVEGVDSEYQWLDLRDPEGWWRCSIRPDGCVDLHRYFNHPLGDDRADEDSIHICDIDEMIDRLQEIRVRAKVHFGEDWQ